MKKYYDLSSIGLSSVLTFAIALALLGTTLSVAQQPDSLTLRVPFKKEQVFDVPYSDLKVMINIPGFEPTYDSQPDDDVIVVAGNSKRRMVVKITADTLYSDLENKASEYRELWWYFYTLDSTLDIGKERVWDDEGRNWSTHTIMTSYNVEVNERHYDMFEIYDRHVFHVSIKRPLYLKGDSTLMLDILNSFEILAPEKSTK